MSLYCPCSLGHDRELYCYFAYISLKCMYMQEINIKTNEVSRIIKRMLRMCVLKISSPAPVLFIAVGVAECSHQFSFACACTIGLRCILHVCRAASSNEVKLYLGVKYCCRFEERTLCTMPRNMKCVFLYTCITKTVLKCSHGSFPLFYFQYRSRRFLIWTSKKRSFCFSHTLL
jgi:hypothetical protein